MHTNTHLHISIAYNENPTYMNACIHMNKNTWTHTMQVYMCFTYIAQEIYILTWSHSWIQQFVRVSSLMPFIHSNI